MGYENALLLVAQPIDIIMTGGVPGSMRCLILSLQVVIDQTIKQLSLYFLCSSKSLDIMVDFVKI
jgi:hypothetical protein